MPSPAQPTSARYASPTCPCGGSCPRRAPGAVTSSPSDALDARQHRLLRTHFGRDLPTVRLHRGAVAARSAAWFDAPAYALGRHIVIGRHAPALDSAAGMSLLAHEVAHTLQADAGETHGARSVSTPDDALEANAHALAQGVTRDARRAPAGQVLRGPFDAETADERERRQTLLRAIDLAIDGILRLMRTGGLLRYTEAPATRSGARGVIYGAHTAGTASEVFTSYADRDARLRRIVRSLIAMGTMYRSAPIPAEFSPPECDIEGSGYTSTIRYPPGSSPVSSSYGARSAMWTDLQAAFERYRITLGETGPEFDSDWYYIDPRETIEPGAARGAPRIGRGVPSGACMVFPDLDGEPLRYWRLDGFTPVPRGSVIIEFWHDDFGFY